MIFSPNIRVLAWLLFGTIAVLSLLHFIIAPIDFAGARLFDLDKEASFATAFASGLGFVVALVALGVACAAKSLGENWFWWAFLAFSMAAYAVDEVAQVHEGVGKVLDEASRGTGNPMAGIALMGYLSLPIFLFATWKIVQCCDRTSAWLIGGGIMIFWAGAFLVEELEYLHSAEMLAATRSLSAFEGHLILTGIQEGLELIAVAMILIGVLGHMARRSISLTLGPVSGRPNPHEVVRPDVAATPVAASRSKGPADPKPGAADDPSGSWNRKKNGAV